jgi:hypothetical protein
MNDMEYKQAETNRHELGAQEKYGCDCGRQEREQGQKKAAPGAFYSRGLNFDVE